MVLKRKPGMKSKKESKPKKKHTKRWKKGHSSESNPESKTHRLAAKNRFFSVNTGPSDLTVEAIAKHDANQEVDSEDEVMSDARSETRSVGGKTYSTWATNWTDCTNATFSKVTRYAHSNSAIHKEILAVLAAVTEVIKAQGGKETETEYFAALMTVLETVEGEQSIAAVTYLLSLAIKRVPASVLRSKFSDISTNLLNVLATHVNCDSPALLSSVLRCLSLVLRQQDQAAWNNSSTTQIYNGLLAFITHHKPKVRKAAHQAVQVVLKTSEFMLRPEPPTHHPAASTTAKFCIKQMEESGGVGEATGTLHTLELLRSIMALFPQTSLKSSCETILRLMTLSNVLVTSVAMRTLHGMFDMKPKETSMAPELNAQVITALYDYQPGDLDVQPLGAWLAVMERAHVNLARLDHKLCLSHLPRLFVSCMSCMQAERPQVTDLAATTLKGLLKDCVCESVVESSHNMAPTAKASPIHKMFAALEGGLSYQYHASWKQVLQVITIFFQVLGKQCYPITKKCLLSLADLRDSYKFPYKGELDAAVGMAIKTMGPQHVLEAIPLQITGNNDDYDFPRSWLLPVLRENICHTELAFFTTYFLPLAAKLHTKSIEYAEGDRVVESKTYDAIQLQIWSLLPGFCTEPTDLAQSFQHIAKILGMAIQDRADLRLEVMASLRKLIRQNMEHDENKAELAKYAKNYLPMLFNMFTTEAESAESKLHLAILETIKTYMSITDPKIVITYFEKCQTKLEESDINSKRRHALLDLCIIMIPYLSADRLAILHSHILKHLQSTDHTVQKKCYRVLEEICGCYSEGCRQFVKDNLPQLQLTLNTSLSTANPSSKAPRLRCLVNVFKQLESDEEEFVLAVIPEAILCTRETAERARTAAYSLLLEMGNALIRWKPDSNKDDVVEKYMELVMAGLAGSPQMVATTELALTRLLIHFKGCIKGDFVSGLLNNVCVLLTSRSREIVISALSLLKVILSIFPESLLAQFLQQMVSSLVSMKDDNRHHFRFKSKEIFARLIRKFGFETIYKLVPESSYKILANIRKTQERAKRKKKEGKKEEEDHEEEEKKARPETIDELLEDSDDDLEEDKKKGQKGRGQRSEKSGAAWLKEGSQDGDIVDFLDPSVTKKVVATKPGDLKDKKGVKHDFKMAPDGRLIITEGNDDEEQKTGKKKGFDLIEEPEDLDDLLEAFEGPSGKSAKSRKRKMSNIEDDEDAGAMKYQAGGSGIHRPIGGAKKTKPEPKEYGTEYRSKKAAGDMKKKGKPDPYAYVPLQLQTLNKRKRAKMAGQFKNLVKGAQKGAAKGKKMKHNK